MASSPYYIIQIKESGRNITNYVTNLHYEDCIKEDDLVELKIDGATLELIDSDDFIVGNHVIYSFGLGERVQSGQRLAVIKDIDVDYAKTISMTIKCRDTGFYMKKETSNKVYTNKTSSQIVSDICNLYGYVPNIDKSTFVHKSISQGNKTFHQFCNELAKKEGSNGKDGSFEFYVRGNELYFQKRNLKKDSKRLFTYGDGNDIVKYFNPSYSQENEGKSDSVTVAGIDKETGEQFTSKAGSKSNPKTALGKVQHSFDWKGKEVGISNPAPIGEVITTGKNIAVPVDDKVAADKITSASQKDANKSQLQMEMGIDLDPTINAGDIITVSGVAKKHSGNWYVTKVVHQIGSGASTVISADKNASHKSLTNNTAKTSTNTSQNNDVNETKGKNSQEQVKKMHSYNWEGKEKK